MVRVAINGFGRIGRTTLASAIKYDKNIQVVAINDLAEPETLLHLLKYDSVYGRSGFEIGYNGGDTATIASHEVTFTNISEPDELDWKKFDIDVVIEATGRYKTREQCAQHLKAGAKKVVVSSPCPEADAMVVLGVNDDELDPINHRIISNASCTTNCLAPMVKVLDNNFGIENGLITTIHAYTATQNAVDGVHSDLRRARACAINLVPTTTGAARTVGKVVKHLEGSLDGMAMRVPTPAGSATDFVCNLKTSVSKEQINDAFRQASQNDMAGIISVCDDPIVSRDVIGSSESCIIDSDLTMAMASEQPNGSATLAKVIGWYDNEWGYSTRLAELVELVGANVAHLN